MGIKVVHDRMAECGELFEDKFICTGDSEHEFMVAAKNSLSDSLRSANQILRERKQNRLGIIVVTGSIFQLFVFQRKQAYFLFMFHIITFDVLKMYIKIRNFICFL